MRRLRKYSPLLLALVLCGAGSSDGGAPIDGPPPGITPASVTLSDVRALHQRAIAGVLPDAYRLHRQIDADGLHGTIDTVVFGSDVREDRTLGPMHTAEGLYHGRHWQQNATGEVVTLSNVHRRTNVDERVESNLTAGATLLGEVQTPVHAYVVRIDPPAGRLEYAFYDTQSGALDRTESVEAGARITSDYDAYALVGTKRIPWHVHRLNGKTGEETDIRILSADTSTPIAGSALAPPASVNPLSFPSSPSALPARILSDRIVVRTSINGRPVNLQLDSGSSGILIDKRVLDAVGVRSYGTRRAITAGLYTVQHATVPRIDIGAASLKDVNVESADFSEILDDHTVVAGLLGFDFLDGAVVKLDYASNAVSLIDPSTFAPPADATAVPIVLDDFVPAVSATIAGATAPHMVVDTGADRSMLFSQFVQAHPESMKDQGLGTLERETRASDLKFSGVGGRLAFRQLQLGPYAVAGVTFPSWLFITPEDAASFEYEDIDGLVGQDVLRYFDVYLDYAHERIYFVPNQRYRDRFS